MGPPGSDSASADAVDSEGVFPEAAVSALRGSGLLGLTLPESVGGLGQGPEQFRDVISQIAGACGSTAMIYLMHISAAMPLAANRPQAYPHLLEGLANGKLLGTLAFSERGSRSHFWAPVSKCSQDADRVHLQVEKSWVTSAGYADVYVISTQSANAESPSDSDLYAVLGTDSGIKIAAPWVALGLRGNASSPVNVDTTVSQGARVGEVGSGFGTMMQVVLPCFNLGNASVTSAWHGRPWTPPCSTCPARGWSTLAPRLPTCRRSGTGSAELAPCSQLRRHTSARPPGRSPSPMTAR